MKNNTVETTKGHFEIAYDVPTELIDELNMYIEDCIGTDDIVVLDDVTETETIGGIKGTVCISFDDDHPFDLDYLCSISSTLADLSSGKSLIVNNLDF